MVSEPGARISWVISFKVKQQLFSGPLRVDDIMIPVIGSYSSNSLSEYSLVTYHCYQNDVTTQKMYMPILVGIENVYISVNIGQKGVHGDAF